MLPQVWFAGQKKSGLQTNGVRVADGQCLDMSCLRLGYPEKTQLFRSQTACWFHLGCTERSKARYSKAATRGKLSIIT